MEHIDTFREDIRRLRHWRLNVGDEDLVGCAAEGELVVVVGYDVALLTVLQLTSLHTRP